MDTTPPKTALVQFSTCLEFSSDVRFYWFVIGMLSVWRVTHLLAVEDGPWHILARLRRRAGDGSFATLLDCFYCLSLWLAAPIAWMIGDGWKERTLLWLAFSGGAILLERATSWGATVPPAVYREEKESDDELLRKKQDSSANRE